MRIIIRLVKALCCALAIIASFFLGRSGAMSSQHLHVLRTPLIIRSSDAVPGILPTGTTLEYVERFSEGFDRYRVYVNVERRTLPLSEAPKRNYVSPVAAVDDDSAHAVLDSGQLRELLRSLRVRKDDLERLVDTYDE
ncbi:hypothetical protein [Sorangium sp. So ce426]|uniref:hypothetical protein n=1 Tax=Sorangium sp. So ce426 TaxID=3133312 RepID=UPI003F5B17B7